MIGVIDRAIATVQSLATQLRPSLLDNLGLAAAIEWQVEESAKRSEMQHNLEIEPPDIAVGPEVATAVFRILQESLNNVARHARASTVEHLAPLPDDRWSSWWCGQRSRHQRTGPVHSGSLGIVGSARTSTHAGR